MSFTAAIQTCFRKYVTFSGRASRPEYWYFVLFIFLGSFVCGVLDTAIFGATVDQFEQTRNGTDGGDPVTVTTTRTSYGNGPIASVFSLATFLPVLAAGWRRMHDTGRSGLYLLYPLIVVIGIVTFTGFFGGFQALFAGGLEDLIAGTSMLILALATIILILSPFLVLWWLTRPSQPMPNEYGDPPAHIAPHPVQEPSP